MGKGLLDGMGILKGIALGLGALAVIAILVLLIVGVLTKTVQDGNIPINNATYNVSIPAINTDVNTYVDDVLDNLPLIIGLVALVVVLAVIGWMVFGRGKSGYGGDDSF